jgi:hypothetical protein
MLRIFQYFRMRRIKKNYTVIIFLLAWWILIYIFTSNLNSENSMTKVRIKKFSKRCTLLYSSRRKQYTQKIGKIVYPPFVRLSQNRSINFECLNQMSQGKFKYILDWNGFFENQAFEQYKRLEKNCPMTNCIILSNRSLVNKSHMVLVQVDKVNNKTLYMPPNYRPPKQMWIGSFYEPPLYSTFYHLAPYYAAIDLTLGFSLRSDFPGLFEFESGIKWTPNVSFNEDFDFYANKTKFAAAVMTNCNTYSRRETYIGEMQKFVKVDIFGRCGSRCPVQNDIWNGFDCKQNLARNYKFILAFEGGICKEYITEKFFRLLRLNIIPVVFGGGPYDRYVS